jgi:fructokinase
MHTLQTQCAAEMLIVTRGAAGAVVLAPGGEESSVVPELKNEVVDTVGAGDAFTSVMTLGLLSGWRVPLMLERAQAFASAVTGIRGATTDDPGFYQPFIDRWVLE